MTIAGRNEFTLYLGDCLAGLTGVEAESVDAMVTDPPAGIGFMGKQWDSNKGGRVCWIAWMESIMREAIRVLKPATEHWILVRKPLAGTVAANVQEHGTGALNIDACRINPGEPVVGGGNGLAAHGGRFESGETNGTRPLSEPHAEGRWPANLVLSHTEWCEASACLPGCPVALLDAQSGTLRSGSLNPTHRRNAENKVFGKDNRIGGPGTKNDYQPNEGGASRFFYTSKPTTAEREENLRDLPQRAAAELTGSPEDSARLNSPRTGAGRTSRGRANIHPTVKSVALMSWLITLITPPGGLVLDPFTGSGTTGVTAIRLGHSFLGFEVDPDYHRIAMAKLERARRGEQREIFG